MTGNYMQFQTPIGGVSFTGMRMENQSLYIGGAVSPAASAVLELGSTTKGILPPRWTSAQRTAISSPATGLFGYQTDGTEGVYFKQASAFKRLLWDGDNISNLSTTITSGHVLYSTGSAVAGSANHFWDNTNSRLGLGNAAPARTLHVTGEARITDLTTDAPTRIVGADADGDLGELAIAGGLSISGGVLTGLNGIYSGSGTLSQTDTYAAMDAAGTKSFGIGYLPSFPTLAYDGTDYGVYISPSNSIIANVHGDVLQELFDDNYRVGTYDFTGTNSGKYAQILINKSDNAVKFSGVESGSYSYKFPTTSPSATTGRKQFIEWNAGLPSFKDRYETDTLWNAMTHIKYDPTQDFVIGSFADPTSPDYENDIGLMFSTENWGSIGIFNKLFQMEIYPSGLYSNGYAYVGSPSANAYSQSSINSLPSISSMVSHKAIASSSPDKKIGGFFGVAAADNGAFSNSVLISYWNKNGASSGIKNLVDTLTDDAVSVTFSAVNLDTVDYHFTGAYSGGVFPSTLEGGSGTTSGINTLPTLPGLDGTKRFEIARYIEDIDVTTKLFSVDFQQYLGNAVKLYDKYTFPNATPSTTSGAVNIMKWTGDGSNANPAFHDIKTEPYNTITSTSSPQTLSSTTSDNLINQGSTQATFTFNLPASPVDGQVAKLTFVNAVTTLTIDGNGTSTVGTLPTSAMTGTQIIFKNYTGVGWVRQL
jgi:hypothetical protein